MMSLYRPIRFSPSINSDTTTVDVAEDSYTVSCVVEGNEGVVEYEYNIYDLQNTGEEPVYTQSDECSPVFYPVNPDNTVNVFKILVKKTDYNTSLINGKEYKHTIKLKGTEGGETQSYEEVFYTEAKPTAEINSDDFVIESGTKYVVKKSATFKGAYSSNGLLKCYGWLLTNKITGRVLVDSYNTNHIYATANNIVINYDGFMSNNSYNLKLKVISQNDVEIVTEVDFEVRYTTESVSADFKVQEIKQEYGIICDWSDVHAIMGKTTTDDSISYIKDFPVYQNNSIYLDNELQSVYYDSNTNSNLIIEDDASIYWCGLLLSPQTIWTLVDESKNYFKKLKYENNKFVYSIADGEGERSYVSDDYNIGSYNWFSIVCTPNNIIVTNTKAHGGLYPSAKIMLPEYPSHGKWVNS